MGGRTLVRPDPKKMSGYCAANSVVQNQLLQAQLKDQAEEIQMLKHADAMGETDADLSELKESRKDSPDVAESLQSMLDAREKIKQQVKDVARLEHSTVFGAALRESPDGLEPVIHSNLGDAAVSETAAM